jgi:hypothetical protein
VKLSVDTDQIRLVSRERQDWGKGPYLTFAHIGTEITSLISDYTSERRATGTLPCLPRFPNLLL